MYFLRVIRSQSFTTVHNLQLQHRRCSKLGCFYKLYKNFFVTKTHYATCRVTIFYRASGVTPDRRICPWILYTSYFIPNALLWILYIEYFILNTLYWILFRTRLPSSFVYYYQSPEHSDNVVLSFAFAFDQVTHFDKM
jgi:hypothetical protein